MLVERASSSLAKTGINQTPARVRQGQVPRLQGDFLGTQMPPATRCPQRDPDCSAAGWGAGLLRVRAQGTAQGASAAEQIDCSEMGSRKWLVGLKLSETSLKFNI